MDIDVIELTEERRHWLRNVGENLYFLLCDFLPDEDKEVVLHLATSALNETLSRLMPGINWNLNLFVRKPKDE